MSISREIWTACREDYIRGRGSLAVMASRHGLKKASVEKCAKRESWTKLRREFEKHQLEKLLPPALPSPPFAPVAPDGVVSDGWLAQRLEIHFQKNMELLDKTRTLLDTKLTANEKPSMDELGKMTTALAGIVTAEIALLGLNRRKDKRRRSTPDLPPPTPHDPLQLTPTHETSN